MDEIYGRYKNIRNSSWQVLIDNDISALPVKVSLIAANAGIKLIKDSAVHCLSGSETGRSIEDKGKWFIIYDDATLKTRIRFTIAHELGHIFLGHPVKNGIYTRTINAEKPIIETEADMFASRLLAPACILYALDIHSAEDIAKLCNVSMQAAQIRAERMSILYERNKFLSHPLELQLYNQFQQFISNFINNTN